jgi:hypothetical protein
MFQSYRLDPSRSSLGRDPHQWIAAAHGGTTLAGCGGSLPGDVDGSSEKVNAMADEGREGELNRMDQRKPYRVRLPGFISDQDVGLGDVIKRVAYTVGIKPCGGCERRAGTLNRLFVFTGRR